MATVRALKITVYCLLGALGEAVTLTGWLGACTVLKNSTQHTAWFHLKSTSFLRVSRAAAGDRASHFICESLASRVFLMAGRQQADVACDIGVTHSVEAEPVFHGASCMKISCGHVKAAL